MKAPIHFADARRRDGTRYKYEQQRGQIKQYPVICALDFVEQETTMRSRREFVVTDSKKLTTCEDCLSRL